MLLQLLGRIDFNIRINEYKIIHSSSKAGAPLL
jgi:hypothetical protein